MSQEKKEIGILIGRGENCTCPDCPVLYGDECPTTPINNKLNSSPIVEEKEGWEERFDACLGIENWGGKSLSGGTLIKPSDVKSFISHTLAEERERIVKEIGNMKEKYDPETDTFILIKDPSAVDGYNLAIEDIINIIKNNK